MHCWDMRSCSLVVQCQHSVQAVQMLQEAETGCPKPAWAIGVQASAAWRGTAPAVAWRAWRACGRLIQAQRLPSELQAALQQLALFRGAGLHPLQALLDLLLQLIDIPIPLTMPGRIHSAQRDESGRHPRHQGRGGSIAARLPLLILMCINVP